MMIIIINEANTLLQHAQRERNIITLDREARSLSPACRVSTLGSRPADRELATFEDSNPIIHPAFEQSNQGERL
jgi:hypothetical protein